MSGAYDAIVCGGSFGGLAAASQIGGRVLVIDRLRDRRRRDVGVGRPAGAASSDMDLLDCVEQVHAEIVIHTRRRSQRLRFFDFATFDYRRFCTDLFARTGAEFLRARITGAGDGVVHTSEGTLRGADRHRGGRVAHVGAQGPRRRRRARAPRKSFGVEARQPYRGDGLHFYVGPQQRQPPLLLDLPGGRPRPRRPGAPTPATRRCRRTWSTSSSGTTWASPATSTAGSSPRG